VQRRKKPRPASTPHARDPCESSGFYPYLVRFLDWSAARGFTSNTTAARREHLRRFIRWCAERDLDRPQDVTRPILERYRRYLYHYRKESGEPLSFATQQQRLLPLRAFFKWLARENLILSNPASELELPRTHRRLPSILSRDDIERVLALTNVHGELGVRDRAMLETLYSTGIRRAELAGLKLYDLDLRNGSLFVREGKGKKDRYVPLGQRAIDALRRYLDDVRPALVLEPDDGSVFLHEYGEPFEKNRLSDLVKRYLLAAGIDKPGACHLFRHAMATQMLENGADIRFIQAILGHAQLTTTEIYTHVSIAQLKKVHALTHPAERPRERPNHGDTSAADAETLHTSLAADVSSDE
jgi:integrase/recombinase XerD